MATKKSNKKAKDNKQGIDRWTSNGYGIKVTKNATNIKKVKSEVFIMKKENIEFIAEKTRKLLSIPFAGEDAKTAGTEWLKNTESPDIEEKTGEYIAVLEQEIMPIDSAIAFAGSDMGKNILGVERAEEVHKASVERKERGEKYCGCEACACAEAIINLKDKL